MAILVRKRNQSSGTNKQERDGFRVSGGCSSREIKVEHKYDRDDVDHIFILSMVLKYRSISAFRILSGTGMPGYFLASSLIQFATV